MTKQTSPHHVGSRGQIRLNTIINVGQRVVIADWRCDLVGMGLAEKLASAGCWVRLAVNGTMAGQTIEALGGVIARLAPSLRAVGIEMIQGRGGKKRKRTWTILYKADP